jgi:hypothetical protein
MTSLPNAVNYSEGMPALPENSRVIDVAVNPTNGSSFTPGAQAQFDLISRGFLIPDSLYLSYKGTVASAGNAQMRGCPAYSSFSNLTIQVGSQTIDSQNSYNAVMTMLTNCTLSVSEKYGMQSAYGYGSTTAATTVAIEDLDGALLVGVAQAVSFSVPLNCVLSNSEKLLPLFAMPQVRINLTVDSITNIFTNVVVPTAWTLSNMELRYRVIDFGPEVENMVRQMGPVLNIKSQSFAASTQTLAAGASGQQDLVFNQRYASCKSVFALNGTSDGSANSFFDSVNLKANTTYAFMIAGVQYPQKPIDSAVRSQALMELKGAVGSIYDRNNSFSINKYEFSWDDVDAACTYKIPGKFIIGTSLEKLNTDALLTGISTQNSPITYRLSLGGATDAQSTITLIMNYDAIFEVDLVNNQTVLRT